jgi:hypothetical protein
MLRSRPRSRSPVRSLSLAAFAAIGLTAATAEHAEAGPLCSDLTVFPVSLAEFESCVVEGENDHLPAVQLALDQALTTDIVLQGAGSFSPGPESSGEEFGGSDPANNFVIDPDDLAGSTSFTFEELPPGTLFIVLKQQNDFEIFKVPGPVPFTLTHQLGGEDTSHISTFVPEATTGLLLAGGLLGLASIGRRRAA